jgi:hypothetical protein
MPLPSDEKLLALSGDLLKERELETISLLIAAAGGRWWSTDEGR